MQSSHLFLSRFFAQDSAPRGEKEMDLSKKSGYVKIHCINEASFLEEIVPRIRYKRGVGKCEIGELCSQDSYDEGRVPAGTKSKAVATATAVCVSEADS
jgi:hypothetical protein